MTPIAKQIHEIRKAIAAAESRFNRATGSVQLLAVSKSQAVSAILAAFAAGQHAFAENYVQEALPKIQALTEYNIEWHFIGNIQANKTKLIAANFAWVHSVDNLKIAERLNSQRPQQLPPLNICLEVKLSDEENKKGIQPDELLSLAQCVSKLPHLKLRGLMVIPAWSNEEDKQRSLFHRLAELLLMLKANGLSVDTLSMGMSEDYIAAIAEGSTMVRIGTAIFGKRK